MARIDWMILVLAAILISSAQADQKPEKVVRSKNVQFEDSVVEGMNQNSKDALDTVGKKDAAEKTHLYKKRQSYRAEILELSKDMGQLP